MASGPACASIIILCWRVRPSGLGPFRPSSLRLSAALLRVPCCGSGGLPSGRAALVRSRVRWPGLVRVGRASAAPGIGWPRCRPSLWLRRSAGVRPGRGRSAPAVGVRASFRLALPQIVRSGPAGRPVLICFLPSGRRSVWAGAASPRVPRRSAPLRCGSSGLAPSGLAPSGRVASGLPSSGPLRAYMLPRSGSVWPRSALRVASGRGAAGPGVVPSAAAAPGRSGRLSGVRGRGAPGAATFSATFLQPGANSAGFLRQLSLQLSCKAVQISLQSPGPPTPKVSLDFITI